METGSEPLAPRIGPLCHCQYCRGGKDYLVTDGPFAYPFDLWCTHASGSEPTRRRSIDRFVPPPRPSRERERYPFPNALPLTNLALLPFLCQRVSYCFEIEDNEMPFERRGRVMVIVRRSGAALLFSIDTRVHVYRGHPFPPGGYA